MKTLDVELPEALGTCRRRGTGEAGPTFFLIATGPGHPPAEERSVLDVLQHLHGPTPIGWLFESLDGAVKSGDIFIDQREADVAPYRSMPNRDHTAAIAELMIRQGTVSAAKGFAMMCEPAVHLQPFDDWYAWARQRDALYRLDGEAGHLERACSLLDAVLPRSGPERESFDTMAGLARLAWTGADWVARKPRLPIDPAGLLSRIDAAENTLAATAEFLIRFQLWACDFYESGVARTEALVGKALEALRRAGASRGAIILGGAWIESAAELLVNKGVELFEIWPRKLSMSSMLDQAPRILDEFSDSRRKLKELMLGEEIRSRVKVLTDDPRERRRNWARDWSAAAQGLLFSRQLDKADECARRALEIDPTWAEAWTSRGIVARERRDHLQAVTFFERAVAMNPRDSRYRGLLGEDLDAAGRTRDAYRAIVKGIRLDPVSGEAWCRLGFHLHRHGERRQACYCFERGKDYGDPAAADNWRIACHSPATRRDCPREVRPWRLAFEQRWRKLARKLRLGA